jgi:hypothetical protein
MLIDWGGFGENYFDDKVTRKCSSYSNAEARKCKWRC